MPDTGAVLTQQDARHLVEDELAAMNVPEGLVIIDVREVPVGWIFLYGSVRHQRSGALSDALAGNAPLLVDRDTGAVHVTGTARPVEDYVAEYIAARTQD